MARASLIVRSVLWTAVLPGFFAGYAPWRYVGLNQIYVDWNGPMPWIGAVLIAAGALVLVTCIVEFARRGRGTLSPVDPPRVLVVQGLYRYVRNPMYVGVTTIVIGEAVLAQSRALAMYCALWFTAVNLFIVGYEEPTLRNTFGASYDAYCQRVRRWIPSRP